MTEQLKIPAIHAMTKGELAARYGITVKTLNKWLKPFITEIGPRNNTYFFTPAQIKIIYEKLETP